MTSSLMVPRAMFEARPRPDLFLAPDGTEHREIWWDNPTQPDTHIPLSRSEVLIPQINEQGFGGKQSCWLTSQLNAWILRGSLTPEEAASVQEIVRSDPQFERYWVDQDIFDNEYTTWTGPPGDTAYVVRQIIGKKMALSMNLVVRNPEQQIGDALSYGFAVVLKDEKHSRTAFQPEGIDGVFVFDSKYPEYTGQYNPATAFQLHTDTHLLVI